MIKDERGKRRVKFRVDGRVQGVSFRFSAQVEARRLGVNGWVQNQPGGEVAGEAEGDSAAVAAFLAWCAKGPPGACVDSCRADDQEYRGDLRGFEIRR